MKTMMAWNSSTPSLSSSISIDDLCFCVMQVQRQEEIEKPRLVGLGYRSVKQTITKHLKSFAASQLAINNFTFHSS